MGIFDSKEKKPRPDFSNVQSGSSSTAPAPASQADGDATPVNTTSTYVVVAGDSLSRIAQHKYGDAKEWRRIFDANRDMIKDPNLIYPGQQLRIPN